MDTVLNYKVLFYLDGVVSNQKQIIMFGANDFSQRF